MSKKPKRTASEITDLSELVYAKLLDKDKLMEELKGDTAKYRRFASQYDQVVRAVTEVLDEQSSG